MFRNAIPRSRIAAMALVAAPALASGLATASSAAADTPPAAPPARHLVVGSTGSGNTSVLNLARDGALTKATGSPVKTAGGFSVVVTPDGGTVYVAGLDGTLAGYRLAADGAMTAVDGARITAGAPVVGLAVTPDGARLYATIGGGSGEIRSYSIASSGALAPTGRPPAAVPGGLSLSLPAITPDARHMYAVSSFTDQVFSYAIAPDGGVTQIGDPIETGLLPVIPSVTPDGRFLYLTEEQGNKVDGFAIGKDGKLTPVPGKAPETGWMPHGVAITADSQRLYLPEAGGGQVRGYRIGADGALTPLPGSPYAGPGNSMPGLVRLSPDGRKLFVIDVLTPNITSKVNTYNVAADGSLSPSGLPAVDTGVTFSDGPNAVVTPDQGPVAAVRAAGTDGRTVTFSAQGSADSDGTVASYRWSFGDGSTATTTKPEVSHTYGAAGEQTATVTVVDDEGCSDRAVYTGQTVTCNGGPRATATASVTVR